jgi:spore germination protein YaaH
MYNYERGRMYLSGKLKCIFGKKLEFIFRQKSECISRSKLANQATKKCNVNKIEYVGKFIVYILIIVILYRISGVNVNADKSGDRLNMAYIFGNSLEFYYSNIEKTEGAIDTICPDFFTVDNDGNLVIRSKIDKEFVDKMHSRGIKVTPYISNEWNRKMGENALINRAKLAEQIKAAIYEYNLDGVNVDIENVDHNYREEYTDFVKLLKQIIPEKIVAVAVAANPKGWTEGWHGSYDYYAIAQSSDYILLMAYDEHYSGGEPGPVASAEFVEGSIQYALDQGVPKEKLVLGIPFYGRYWIEGKETGGYGIASADVEAIIQKYNGTVTYDETSQTSVATVIIEETDEKYRLWSGVYLSAGTYRIWYDSDKALKYKLDFVKKYDLKGVGSWSLGQEPSNTWSYFDAYLNGTYFYDLENHWAEGHAMDVYKKGWMIGTAPNTFSPGKTLTRAEAAVILVRALGLSNEIGDSPFADTYNHWANHEISIARKYGICNGIGNDLFAPDRTITREEMFVMLDRIVDMPEVGIFAVQEFTDLSKESNSWSYDSIIKLSSNGVIFGFSDSTCRPYDNISRAETAAVMNRVSRFPMKIQGISNEISNEASDEISDEASNATSFETLSSNFEVNIC